MIVPVVSYSQGLSLTIKVHDVQNGWLLATRNVILESSSYSSYLNSKNYKIYATKIQDSLREIFPVAVYIKEVKDKQVILSGADIRLFYSGMKLKDEFSGSILEVVEVDYKNGQVISTLVSGKIPPIGSLVVETWVNK